MAALRPFQALDLLRFNRTNLDHLTENYDITFYLSYLAKWPLLFNVIEGANGQVDAYIMGKLESSPATYQASAHALPWHAHITALTVAPAARRTGLARRLTEALERVGEQYDGWFVDLYVRESNGVAIGMYAGMGYSVFRRVVGYYSDDPTTGLAAAEDAFDMRKPLARDKTRRYVREGGERFRVWPDDVW
ncbi:MAG: hypothetical protein M1826_003663 [Phylliscum demangeonii]|nr:MAG: hypothetical protein M1826_003663 [Phylliscum demangeonii]